MRQRFEYQLCPKCKGQGIVSRPPWVPADAESWSSSQSVFTCDVCNGSKTLLIQVTESDEHEGESVG